MEIITSLENKKIKMFESLRMKKYRDKYDLFIVEEVHLIQEAIRNVALDTLIIRNDLANIFDFPNVMRVSDQVMKKLSGNVSLNDYIGICDCSKGIFAPESRTQIVLEDVQDPGNVGTILRTALSFGFKDIILSKGCADVYNEKTVKASQGAIFDLNIVRYDTDEIISRLKTWKYPVIVTALKDSDDLEDFSPAARFALVFGNEGKGVSEKMLQAADKKIRIRMEGFDSLNVAVAAGICMYRMKIKGE